MTVSTDYSATATTGTGTGTGSTIATSGIEEEEATDYDVFLQLLVTQMQNQDPTDPIDSNDYAQQLASFTSVELQTETNALLTTIVDQMDASGMTQMTGWVGQEARAEVEVVYDGSTPVTLSPEPAEGADSTVLVVTNASGETVSRQNIPVSDDDYLWDGTTQSGEQLPAGTYSFYLESYSGETLISTTAVQSYNEIVEVQAGEDGTILVLEGGTKINSDEVTALRDG